MQNNELDKYNKILQNKATDIYNETKDPNSVEFDPMTIIMIIGLIINIIRLYKSCNLNEKQILKRLERPRLFDRFTLKNQIALLDTKLDKSKLQESYLKVGKTFTLEEIQSLYKEFA